MKRKKTLVVSAVTSIAIASLLIGFSDSNTQAQPAKKEDPYELSPEVQQAYQQLNQHEAIQRGLAFIKDDHDQTIQDQITITEIPAPPFKEEERAKYYMSRLQELGLADVQQDEEGNVFGTIKGVGNGPTLYVSAHLDTVFPEGTDTKVKEKDGKLYAPGIGDDGRGLASLLSVVRAFKESGVQPVGDIILGGNVGEEGLGDLRGMKYFFSKHPEVDGFISMDGLGASEITYLATGSHRYEITYKGPGGHSFNSFGSPSATHAMGRAIADIADLKTPSDPKTTFTVGTVEGGTSVNAIAEEAKMLVDMRSNDEEELLKLEKKVLAIVKEAAQKENKRWNSDEMKVDIKQVGDRPAASQPKDATIIQSAWASTSSIEQEPKLKDPSSTDANYPMSLGIPSLTLGQGGKGGGAHTVDEWFDPTDAYLGPQRTYMTILGLVGVKDVFQPLLEKRQ
ncbi:M20/M25/M40 family metallo-hydrolase [Desmospora activa]|uniref:Acetylornithine deacetylase/succinyl-diaminopimelate desuccinylase-like protein n=1 Tax=Desmospora activa DSM 45169 TaxID=1121389 RepID=A0A2T4Z7F4_9BACL|nr:acetylornithine deacetylase/succinyl-diaminopimelate desuccinylase-like protein [Desmospora activa DSM 45169]